MDDRAPWSDCPKDILAAIAKRFHSMTDILRLRSVCTSWHSSVASPFHKSPPFLVKLPLPISPFDSVNPNRDGYFALTEIITHRLEPLDAPSNSSGSPKGWLVTIEEGEPGKMLILNPLSLFQDPQLPVTFPKVLNLLDFRVSEISRAYYLEYTDSNSIPDDFAENSFLSVPKVVDFAENPFLSVPKVVVSSDPDWTSSDLAVLVLKNIGKLVLFKQGDVEWTISSDFPSSCFDDIINYKGNFYATDQAGRLVMLDSSLNEMEIVPPFTSSGNRKHLVKSSGNLLLVDRYMENEHDLLECNDAFDLVQDSGLNFTYDIEVFKLNEQEHCWVKVKSLCDKVLFVGDQCFSITSRDFYGSNGNCIYFRDEYIGATSGDCVRAKGVYGHNTCVFTIGDGKLGPLDDFPGYADIYWPPTKLVG